MRISNKVHVQKTQLREQNNLKIHPDKNIKHC